MADLIDLAAQLVLVRPWGLAVDSEQSGAIDDAIVQAVAGMQEAQRDRDRLAARLAALEAACRPFADGTHTVEDCRRIAEVLAGKE